MCENSIGVVLWFIFLNDVYEKEVLSLFYMYEKEWWIMYFKGICNGV